MSASADLHDVWNTHLPLGISCNHCLHRALIPRERVGAREGFRCTKCGRRTFTTHLFKEQRHVKRFLAEYR